MAALPHRPSTALLGRRHRTMEALAVSLVAFFTGVGVLFIGEVLDSPSRAKETYLLTATVVQPDLETEDGPAGDHDAASSVLHCSLNPNDDRPMNRLLAPTPTPSCWSSVRPELIPNPAVPVEERDLRRALLAVSAAQHTGRWSVALPSSMRQSAYLAGDEPIAQALFTPTSAVIEAYLAAANAGDLEAILDLYADEAVHIFLPTPDGSAGVCLGKEQFRMWYEQSLANGDRVELEDGTLAVDGNQATFLIQISSDPWRKLGVEALEAKTDLVVIDGRIVTHLVTLTLESVRTLQAARGSTTDLTMGSVAPLLPSERRGSGEPY